MEMIYRYMRTELRNIKRIHKSGSSRDNYHTLNVDSFREQIPNTTINNLRGNYKTQHLKMLYYGIKTS